MSKIAIHQRRQKIIFERHTCAGSSGNVAGGTDYFFFVKKRRNARYHSATIDPCPLVVVE